MITPLPQAFLLLVPLLYAFVILYTLSISLTCVFLIVFCIR